MRVVLAPIAHADLKEIADWIGADDWDHAKSFRRALLEKCETLGSKPARYPLALHAGARSLRKLSWRDHLVRAIIRLLRGLSLTQGFCIIFRR
jgi:plasmid stabilization system protein ParE